MFLKTTSVITTSRIEECKSLNASQGGHKQQRGMVVLVVVIVAVPPTLTSSQDIFFCIHHKQEVPVYSRLLNS